MPSSQRPEKSRHLIWRPQPFFVTIGVIESIIHPPKAPPMSPDTILRRETTGRGWKWRKRFKGVTKNVFPSEKTERLMTSIKLSESAKIFKPDRTNS